MHGNAAGPICQEGKNRACDPFLRQRGFSCTRDPKKRGHGKRAENEGSRRLQAGKKHLPSLFWKCFAGVVHFKKAGTLCGQSLRPYQLIPRVNLEVSQKVYMGVHIIRTFTGVSCEFVQLVHHGILHPVPTKGHFKSNGSFGASQQRKSGHNPPPPPPPPPPRPWISYPTWLKMREPHVDVSFCFQFRSYPKRHPGSQRARRGAAAAGLQAREAAPSGPAPRGAEVAAAVASKRCGASARGSLVFSVQLGA